jgi:FkbM family methyltransferase
MIGKLKKIIKRILNVFGLIILKKISFISNYRLISDFSPLTQLFYKNLHADFFFIQIGANDGISYDPIYDLVTKEKVKGIVIEPIQDIFNQLKNNYRDNPQVEPLNLAIHRDQKEMILYRVDPKNKNYPEWTKGTPSFNKSHHKLSFIEEIDIVEELVKCISFDDLIEQYSIKKIDLLQIDTEGYDLEIIKMINFDIVSPTIISFEHGMKQGIMSLRQFEECQEILFKNNYNIVVLENDAIAYKN